MERNNNLSKNLKTYQRMLGMSQKEFSAFLGIPRSTIQSVMEDGNTTLDTLIRIADALHAILDELVFGELSFRQEEEIFYFLTHLDYFTSLNAEEQIQFRRLLGEWLNTPK